MVEKPISNVNRNLRIAYEEKAQSVFIQEKRNNRQTKDQTLERKICRKGKVITVHIYKKHGTYTRITRWHRSEKIYKSCGRSNVIVVLLPNLTRSNP